MSPASAVALLLICGIEQAAPPGLEAEIQTAALSAVARHQLMERLIVVAADESEPYARRLLAHRGLQVLGTPAAYQHMAAHVGRRLGIGFFGSTEYQPPPQPCYDGLMYARDGKPRRDWAVAPAVFASLEADRPENELRLLAKVLMSNLATAGNPGRLRAIALLRAELDDRPSPAKAKNLRAMLAVFGVEPK